MQDKVYILLAGVNGAGKSTFYATYDENGLLFPFCDYDTFHSLPHVNSDKFAKKLGDWKDRAIQRAGSERAIKMIKNCLAQNQSFSQETTLTGNFILKSIKDAKKLGYKVGIIYVGVDNVDIAKERVRARVERGGHDIPEADIENRYFSSFQNLNKILPLCDGVLFYDNSELNSCRAVAEYDGVTLKTFDSYTQLPTWLKKCVDVPWETTKFQKDFDVFENSQISEDDLLDK